MNVCCAECQAKYDASKDGDVIPMHFDCIQILQKEEAKTFPQRFMASVWEEVYSVNPDILSGA